ncbi:acyl-CoA thioesterase [Propionibacteriaceae bacterium Y1700]|uniref:acyl-CoA thioesterase n=1 Tax=Microlunatus sp. Y1700 TaxID=3418487 RepID=UPI003DA708B7
MVDPSRHTYLCPLRWGDMDALGHVNNALWVDYLQEARVDYLLRGPLAGMLASGVLVTEHQVEHLAPVTPDAEPMRIELWISSVGGARFSLAYELFHHDQLVGRARTVAVPYDLEAGRLRRLSDEERSQLRSQLIDSGALRPVPTALPAEHVTVPCPVRWSDLDSYGHVNNVKFYDYVQEARIAWLTQVLPEEPGVWVVVRQDMRYLAQLDHRLEPYGVRLGVAAVGRTSITVVAEVIEPDRGTVFARATTVLVHLGADSRPAPLPTALAPLWATDGLSAD